MDLTRLLVQVLIALVCAGLATLLLPRKIPGKVFGLLIIGLAGVWLGEWVLKYAKTTYGLSSAILDWSVQGVPILPAVIGSTIILYAVTAFLSWGKYGN